jgi:quercetin dioxygenase-like cupin family protein
MFGINSPKGYITVTDGIKLKAINYGENMMMTEFILQKGSILPEHSHIHEQSGYLIKGKIMLYINDVSRELKPGDSWNIPQNIRHKANIIEDSIALEVFNPVRADYMKFVCEEDVEKVENDRGHGENINEY